MCGDPDYDSTEVHSGWRRARKEHRCVACRETIRRGDRYHRTVQAYDGTVDESRHCARCWFMCEALWADGVESVELDLNCGEIWDDPPDDVAALAFMSPSDAQAKIERGVR